MFVGQLVFLEHLSLNLTEWPHVRTLFHTVKSLARPHDIATTCHPFKKERDEAGCSAQQSALYYTPFPATRYNFCTIDKTFVGNETIFCQIRSKKSRTRQIVLHNSHHRTIIALLCLLNLRHLQRRRVDRRSRRTPPPVGARARQVHRFELLGNDLWFVYLSRVNRDNEGCDSS